MIVSTLFLDIPADFTIPLRMLSSFSNRLWVEPISIILPCSKTIILLSIKQSI